MSSYIGNSGVRKSFPLILDFFAYILFIVTLWLVIYQDDIQITSVIQFQETPTIYNTRILGLKLLDWLSICITFILGLSFILRAELVTTSFHKNMLIVFGVYATAGVIGFIYGLFYDYHWERWYQDFQQTLYFVGYFFVTFYVLSSQRRWYWFLGLFVGFLGLKNIIIFQRLFEGTGRMLGEFGMRTTQSADAAIFPLFFILGLVLILHQRTNFWIKLTLISVLVIYLFNLLIGFGRTIWVVLPVLALYIFFEIDKQQKRKLVLSSILFLTLSIGMALFFFPRYFDLFFWKFSSIFDWSVQGDRSNATRLLEILNIGFRLFDQFAVFHGMGLGAWWDDRFFQLLPDAASGFMGKTRFHTAHLWIVQQWLKIGLIGIVVYWWTISKMFLKARTIMKSINGNEINRMLLLALNAGFIGLFFASTDFVKVFLVVGVVSGMIARLCFFILQNKPMTKLA